MKAPILKTLFRCRVDTGQIEEATFRVTAKRYIRAPDSEEANPDSWHYRTRYQPKRIERLGYRETKKEAWQFALKVARNDLNFAKRDLRQAERRLHRLQRRMW